MIGPSGFFVLSSWLWLLLGSFAQKTLKDYSAMSTTYVLSLRLVIASLQVIARGNFTSIRKNIVPIFMIWASRHSYVVWCIQLKKLDTKSGSCNYDRLDRSFYTVWRFRNNDILFYGSNIWFNPVECLIILRGAASSIINIKYRNNEIGYSPSSNHMN